MINEYATSREEAERRFRTCERTDPLPEIQPALLNSADIAEYVRVAGMVFPFNADEIGKLKSASYEVDFLGDLHLYGPDASYKKIEIKDGEEYPLPKNSISFLFLKTEFRLPDYVAARFNLKITHVHAGLLLGTGPLVDPGFAGRLLIPLHNLTSEDYFIRGGGGLIWVEFTKLSPNRRWDPECERDGDFRSFPDSARHKTAESYFEKALKGRLRNNSAGATITGEVRPARSSIPGEVQGAKQAAESAQRAAEESRQEVERLAKMTARIGYIAGAVSVVAILSTVISILSLVQDANKNVGDASKAISDYRDHQKVYERAIDEFNAHKEKTNLHLKGIDTSLQGLAERVEVASPMAAKAASGGHNSPKK